VPIIITDSEDEPRPADRLLTAEQAAALLACGPSRVYKMRVSGALPTVYLGSSPRARLSDVEALIRSGSADRLVTKRRKRRRGGAP
jgi:predicted DNA-binding transcriptional regulator AlpA